jgi:hypothetical protein
MNVSRKTRERQKQAQRFLRREQRLRERVNAKKTQGSDATSRI